MKKKINHQLINQFLNSIFPLPEQFGVVCSNDYPDEPVYYSSIKKAVKDIDAKALVYFGMSKLVIVSPNLNGYVIKIPFNGCYQETFYEDEDNDEMEWCDFYFATGSDPADYCLTEYENNIDLRNKHFNPFVAKTLFYMEKDGFRIFLQEQVIPFNNYWPSSQPSKKSKKIAKEWRKQKKHYMNSDWVASCIDFYGKKKTEKFFYYCENCDEDIVHDMHDGNFGYRKDGSPVLLDYSGFDQ